MNPFRLIKNRDSKKKRALVFRKQKMVFAGLLIILSLEIIMVIFDTSSFGQAEEVLRRQAARILASCSSKTHRIFCYEEEIPKLKRVMGMEDIFKVLSLVQNADTDYRYCHVAAHRIAEDEALKDPDGWRKTISQCPYSQCLSGCLHGAVVAGFREEYIKDPESLAVLLPELQDVCPPGGNDHIRTYTDLISCYHAIGHVAVYLTNVNIHQSLAICDEIPITTKWRCYEGVFMQVFYPEDPEDVALVEGKKPTKETLKIFCEEFKGEKQGVCWAEGWRFFIDEVRTPSGLVDFCSSPSDIKAQERCFTLTLLVLPAYFQFNTTLIKDFCLNLPQTLGEECFENAVAYMRIVDEALIPEANILCEAAAAIGAKTKCYRRLLYQNHLQSTPVKEVEWYN